MLLERIGNLGIYSLLESKLRGYLAPRIIEDDENNFVLKINPLVLQRLINQHLGFIGGGAKKITFEQVHKEDLKVSRMTNDEISNDEVGNKEIIPLISEVFLIEYSMLIHLMFLALKVCNMEMLNLK